MRVTGRTPTRVVVVTGGAAGIGAAIALEVARQGAYVVTLDPMVTLDGSTGSGSLEPTTADRIVAAGGAARASAASVTDAAAVTKLFTDLVDEFGALDAVVNAAGISRPTSFATGRPEDWEAVLGVHLGGYLTVLRAALPIMAAAGHGRILGVTSGSGWRAADAGAYGCAKRAVAALTWQVGRAAPAGVTVNALSPIAATRMVTAALEAARARAASSGTGGTGGLGLTSMPAPEALGPVAAYLASEEFAWCTGEVLFSNGGELAPVSPPRLLEVVRTRGLASLPAALSTLVPEVLAAAEHTQTTHGATNPRAVGFTGATGADASTGTAVVVGMQEPGLGADVAAALADRGLTVVPLAGAVEPAAIAQALGDDPVEPVSVVMAGLAQPATVGEGPWQQLLDEHETVAADLARCAAWARAVAEHAATAGRAVALVFVTPAYTPAGRTRARALAQLTRGAASTADHPVTAVSIAVESAATEDHRAAGELVAHLVTDIAAARLAGAELGVGAGWLALRTHPTPAGSIMYGGPDVPSWVDAALRELVGR